MKRNKLVQTPLAAILNVPYHLSESLVAGVWTSLTFQVHKFNNATVITYEIKYFLSTQSVCKLSHHTNEK